MDASWRRIGDPEAGDERIEPCWRCGHCSWEADPMTFDDGIAILSALRSGG